MLAHFAVEWGGAGMIRCRMLADSPNPTLAKIAFWLTLELICAKIVHR